MGAEELGILVALRCLHAGVALRPLPCSAPVPQGVVRKTLASSRAAASSTSAAGAPPRGSSSSSSSSAGDKGGAAPVAVSAKKKQPPSAAAAADSGAAAAAADPMSSLPPTRKVYLDDTYRFEYAGATILAASPTEVILDATIFHPQGGGQPADQGVIECDDAVFAVSMAKATARGADARVVHTGTWASKTDAPPSPGATAILKVDAAQRVRNARYHSAGHAIDVAMDRAGYSHLEPAKGYHFADGAYVEYAGVADDAAALVEALNAQLRAIVAEDAVTEVSFDGATGDRIVDIAGKTCPCGGTHVAKTTELGVVTVTKAKNKSKKLRISYVVDDA